MLEKKDLSKPFHIAGDCSDKTQEQLMANAQEAKKRGVILRTGLYKPRTEPTKNPDDFFDGVYKPDKPGGKDCLVWLAEVCNIGVMPALEVNGPGMAYDVLNVLAREASKPRILLWNGSRNQEHRDVVDTAMLIAETPWAMYMVKNQPWPDKRHWKGLIGFATNDGFGALDRERLLVCHRGFYPGKYDPNPLGLRNVYDFDMAMQIKQELGVNMLIDASHMGGSWDKVIKVMEEAVDYRDKATGEGFDGSCLEVCREEVGRPQTDADQHLSWVQYDSLDLARMQLVAA